MEYTKETVKQVVFSIPSIWASTVTLLMGVTLNEWVGYSSILYCALQSIYLIWKWRKEVKE